MLSTKDEASRVTGNSILRRVLVQEAVTVDKGCIISDSILMEHSHVANQGQVWNNRYRKGGRDQCMRGAHWCSYFLPSSLPRIFFNRWTPNTYIFFLAH